MISYAFNTKFNTSDCNKHIGHTLHIHENRINRVSHSTFKRTDPIKAFIFVFYL